MGGIHPWLVNSPTNGQKRGKCFHRMTSSWVYGMCINHIVILYTIVLNFPKTMCGYNFITYWLHMLNIHTWSIFKYRNNMSLRTAISVTPSSYTITEYAAPSDSGFWFCCVLNIYIVSVTYRMHMHAIYSGYHIKQLCHNICHEHKYRSNNQLIPVHECDSRVKFRYWFYLKCLLLSMSPWWSVTFILRGCFKGSANFENR